MKKIIFVALFAVACIAAWFAIRSASANQDEDQFHSSRNETEVLVSFPPDAVVEMFMAGGSLTESIPVQFPGNRIWLPSGNYFLESRRGAKTAYYPIALKSFRSGPDAGGSFVVTVRNLGRNLPPQLIDSLSGFAFIPGGNFLLGDRLNPLEPHYVWLTGYFIGRFEVTNGEFREFLNDRNGYTDDANWTEAGRQWKSVSKSNTTAMMQPKHPDFKRFGRAELAVVWTNWFEANAYCSWLTRKLGGKSWLFSLPNEAEWEKAARGPDSFDYGLGMTIGDVETPLYNWKKNPDAPVTVVGIQESREQFQPNRYGVYHASGNVTEWTQSVNWPFNQVQPFRDDERNHAETPGLRVARGGSWYSASVAYLYIPYRDAFQPEHSTQEIGFRVVARPLP